jgi:hypothetical protein
MNALGFMNGLPFITAREPNRDHRPQGFHYCSSWMCLGNVHEQLCSKMGSTIPAFRWCLLTRCQANGHIPSQYYNYGNTVDGVIFCIYQYFPPPFYFTEKLTQHFKLWMNPESFNIITYTYKRVYEVVFKTRTLPDAKGIFISELCAQQVYFVPNYTYTGDTDVSHTNRKPLHLPRAVTFPPAITDVHFCIPFV